MSKIYSFEAVDSVDAKSKIESDVGVVACNAVEFTLSKEAKARMNRKIDFRLIPPLAILYLISYMDRGSLANASIFGYKTDIKIDTTQYNLIATVFFFSYGCFEIPAVMALHYMKPNLWIAIITLAWGTCTTLSGIVHNYGGALASRFFLGVCEAGFFPCSIFLLSSWYTREELQLRLTVLYVVGTISGAFTGLLAYGLNYMTGVGGLEGWRWLFILEGLATVLLSVFVFFALPDNPTTSKWLTEEEKNYLAQVKKSRNERSDHNLKLKDLPAVVKDYKILMLTWVCMCSNICLFGFSYTLPTILTSMGYTATKAQLMTVPIYAVACFCCFIAAIVGRYINKRSPVVLFGLGVMFIGLVATCAMPKDRLVGVQYFFLFFIVSGNFVAYPNLLSWLSNNAAGQGKRSMATAFQLTLGNLCSAIGTNTYLASQKPHYYLGFGLAIGLCFSQLVTCTVLIFLLKRDNKKKALDKTVYTEEEIEAMGDSAPNFIYIL